MKQRGSRGSASARSLAGGKVQGRVEARQHRRAADAPRTPVRPWARGALFAIFAASGFAGLIYESIWAQYLKLFLGHAAYAQTLVLAIFMGGMALGSWVVSRYCARLRQLLWGYLLVEALIGVLGILFHRVFLAATDFSFATVNPALPAGLAINLYKWSLAA